MNAFARLLLCTALSGLALGAQARTFEVSDFAELDNAVIAVSYTHLTLPTT